MQKTQRISPATAGQRGRLACTRPISTPWARSFNCVASFVLVLVSSIVLARLIRSDPDSAALFSPFYVLILLMIGGFLFSGHQGKWMTVKIWLQVILEMDPKIRTSS